MLYDFPRSLQYLFCLCLFSEIRLSSHATGLRAVVSSHQKAVFRRKKRQIFDMKNSTYYERSEFLIVVDGILRLNVVLTYGIRPEFRGGVHLFIHNRHTPSDQSRVYRVTQLRTDDVLPRVRRHRASKSQGSSERVLPWQVTMDQLICASLSHTHYWYEVGMLKVPAGKCKCTA